MKNFAGFAVLAGTLILLAGCAPSGPGHTVVINPNCSNTHGPQTSPPAPPSDYDDCYPDKY